MNAPELVADVLRALRPEMPDPSEPDADFYTAEGERHMWRQAVRRIGRAFADEYPSFDLAAWRRAVGGL